MQSLRLPPVIAVTCGMLAALAGCEIPTDAATRLAFDLEAAEKNLGDSRGATYTLLHHTPSRTGECVGPYKAQFDQVGAIIIWCHDAAGQTVSSHSTTYHARFVDTPQTWLLEKPAGSTLAIELERRSGRAVIRNVE